MKKMKRRIGSAVLCIVLMLSGPWLLGCDGPLIGRDDANILTVVCTTFAGYDFARQMITAAPDGKAEVIPLGKPGQDLHDYEPSAADILTLGRADVVVCLGSVAEPWLDAALQSAMNETVCRVEMMTVCDLMETEYDHEHVEGETCGLIGSDEHVWLAPENAISISAAIGKALADEGVKIWGGDHRPLQEAKSAAYIAELTALRDAYHTMAEGAKRDTVVVADRYPFAYLFRELGITAYAAFPGCSSETSASFATQTFLIEKTVELGLPYIFAVDGSDGTVAAVVAKESGAEVLKLRSIQVVTDRQQTYIGIMGANLETLKKALY